MARLTALAERLSVTPNPVNGLRTDAYRATISSSAAIARSSATTSAPGLGTGPSALMPVQPARVSEPAAAAASTRRRDGLATTCLAPQIARGPGGHGPASWLR